MMDLVKLNTLANYTDLYIYLAKSVLLQLYMFVIHISLPPYGTLGLQLLLIHSLTNKSEFLPDLYGILYHPLSSSDIKWT